MTLVTYWGWTLHGVTVHSVLIRPMASFFSFFFSFWTCLRPCIREASKKPFHSPSEKCWSELATSASVDVSGIFQYFQSRILALSPHMKNAPNLKFRCNLKGVKNSQKINERRWYIFLQHSKKSVATKWELMSISVPPGRSGVGIRGPPKIASRIH